MKTPLLLLLVAILAPYTLPAAAFECTNAGASSLPPDDNGSMNNMACGNGANSAGSFSTAAGTNAASAGNFSIALGARSSSAGPAGSALGYFAIAEASSSTALGHTATSSGSFSTTLGARTFATGQNSTALGYAAVTPNDNTMVLGSIPGEGVGTEYVDVAIGTTGPLGPLHIFRDDATEEMLILESNEVGGPQDRAMIQLINNGGIRFQFDNPLLGTAWRFQAATGNQDSFEIAKVGTGTIELRIDASGNATLAGMLFENSDRDAKTNIESVDPEAVLARVAELPISEWEYKDTPGQRHLGPMAQDFRKAFGLGANDTSLATIDTSGVALASIKALEARNRALEGEVEALKALVMQLLPQGAGSAPIEGAAPEAAR